MLGHLTVTEEKRRILTSKKYYILGTGRSGTGFMSRVLGESGMRCGHESVVGIRGIEPRFDLWGDASWMAVPYVRELEHWEGVMVHVIRNPLDCIASLAFANETRGRPWMEESGNGLTRYEKYLQRWFNPGGRIGVRFAVYYWCTMNLYLSGVCDWTWKLEDINPPKICKLALAIGLGSVRVEIDKHRGYNARPHRSITWEEIREEVTNDEYEHLRSVAAFFHYI